MIAVIDYGAGNLTSVRLAFEALAASVEITNDPRRVLAAERVVFPGVGAAGSAMQALARMGLTDVIRTVADRGTPFLGICLGTQIIFEHSEEDGGVDGIGLIPGQVRLFRPTRLTDKVPQMGWNNVTRRRPHPVLAGIDNDSEFYFVHSYYPAPSDPAFVIGETEYAGVRFASIVGRGNLLATQFHPEKSGRIGLALLENFMRWQPADSDSAPGIDEDGSC